MADKRERHARILTQIWDDPEWKALSPTAQWLYMLLLSQASLNWAGVIDLTVKRWGRLARSMTPGEIRRIMDELVEARMVIVDEDTEELLVRSYMRNDGVWKQPNVYKAALRQAQEVHSSTIRTALVIELRRIGVPAGLEVAELLDEGSKKASAKGGPKASGNPSAKGSDDGSGTPELGFSEGLMEPLVHPRGVGEGDGETPHLGNSEGPSSSSDVARPDVDELCERLRDRIIANGVKPPVISKQWRTEARLLLDRDGRDHAITLRLIDWATAHSFWKANILSMPTFRRQYDRLLLLARSEQQQRQQARGGQLSTADRRVIEAERLKDNPNPAILAMADQQMGPSLALPGGDTT